MPSPNSENCDTRDRRCWNLEQNANSWRDPVGWAASVGADRHFGLSPCFRDQIYFRLYAINSSILMYLRQASQYSSFKVDLLTYFCPVTILVTFCCFLGVDFCLLHFLLPYLTLFLSFLCFPPSWQFGLCPFESTMPLLLPPQRYWLCKECWTSGQNSPPFLLHHKPSSCPSYSANQRSSKIERGS